MSKLRNIFDGICNITMLAFGVRPTDPADLTHLFELVLEAQQRELASAEKLLAKYKELNATLAGLHETKDVV